METVKITATLLLVASLCGCASRSMLPETAEKVDFASGKEGRTGWAGYREEASFTGLSKAEAVNAAKAGLGSAGFQITSVDAGKGAIVGEHGITLHDWNILAGVYLKQADENTLVVVLVEGSKDVGFAGDQTGGAWTSRILQGMREYAKGLKP